MIIDYTKGLDFPDDKVKQYGNELQSLSNLWLGLSQLYDSTRRIEHKAKEQIENGDVLESMSPEVRKSFEGKDFRYFSVGNDPAFKWLNKGLLYCLFQWYAVSACNYVRLVGWLCLKEVPQRTTQIQYVNSVIPNVLWFRDKIAAHFTRAGSDSRDTEADRATSVLYQVGFEDGRFYAPIWKLRIRRNGKENTSSNKAPWSITETHEALMQRYELKTEEKENGRR